MVKLSTFAKLPLVPNNTTSVFVTLRNKKLSCSQSFTIESCEFNVVWMTLGHLPEKNRTVSLAYIKILHFIVQSGKSFIKRTNKSGPSTDPCGTPVEILEGGDGEFSY